MISFAPQVKVCLDKLVPSWRGFMTDFFSGTKFDLTENSSHAELYFCSNLALKDRDEQFQVIVCPFQKNLPYSESLMWISSEQSIEQFSYNLLQVVKAFENWYDLRNLKNQMVIPKPYLEIFSQRIQNQLKGMSGLANVLRESYLSDIQRQKYADYISGNATRMQSFFANLWEYYQFKHNKQKAKLQTFQLHAFLLEMHERFQRILISQEKDHITFQLTEDNKLKDLEIKADKRRLIIILNNILDNAVQYTNKGQIRWFVQVQGNHLLIGVENDVNETLHKQQKLSFEASLGLGLLVAHYNAEIIGGELSVEHNEKSTLACLRMPYFT